MEVLEQILPNILLWAITMVGSAVIGFLVTKLKKFNTDYKNLIEISDNVKSIDTKVGGIEKKVNKLESDFDDSREDNDSTMKSLLYDRIMQACKYHLGKGFCPIEEKRNIHDLYTQYHNKGGNGLATKEVDKVLELPDIEELSLNR